MAKITHVKKAQQRYATKPVLDAEGNPIRIPLTRNGQPKVTKHGRPVTIAKTERDLTQPLPPLKCDYPGCEFEGKEIRPGMPYKHISPRSGPYGGRQLNRHEECPTWNIWDYSSSLSAMVARAQHDGADIIADAELEIEDDFDSLRDEVAQLAAEIRDEKEENLSNLPESFQQGGELYDQVDALNAWVDEIEGADCPDFPEASDTVTKWFVTGPDDQSLEEDGFGTEDEAKDALTTHLENHPDEDEDQWDIEESDVDVDDPEVPEDELEAWREEARQVLQDALDGFEG